MDNGLLQNIWTFRNNIQTWAPENSFDHIERRIVIHCDNFGSCREPSSAIHFYRLLSRDERFTTRLVISGKQRRLDVAQVVRITAPLVLIHDVWRLTNPDSFFYLVWVSDYSLCRLLFPPSKSMCIMAAEKNTRTCSLVTRVQFHLHW